MALTIGTPKVTRGVGDYFLTITKVDFDSSYPTGGEALTAANLGYNDNATDLIVWAPNRLGYLFEYDAANAKMLAYWIDNNAASDSAAIEVANTTDLSAVTQVVVFALGRKPT